MAYIELADTELDSGITDNRVASFMKKYRDSEKIYDHWKDKYELKLRRRRYYTCRLHRALKAT